LKKAGFLVGKHEGRRHLNGLGVDGKLVLKLILGEWVGRVWTGLIEVSIGIRGRLLHTR
jgi:hypothetical protein